jgi:uncharacterized membrane protein
LNAEIPTYNSAPRVFAAILPTLLAVVFLVSTDCRSLPALEILALESTEAELATRFEKQIRSIVTEHCKECHSKELAEADIDLTEYQSLAGL